MDITIAIDLSHGETVESLPEYLFEEEPEQVWLEEEILLEDLEDVDVLLLGDPRIQKDGTGGFTKEELLAIKKFVARGRGLMVTSSAGGDCGVARSLGSLRVLFKVTGVSRFWNGVIQDPKSSIVSKTNLVLKSMDAHFITRGLTELVFADATFLSITEDADPIVFTEETARFKYFSDKSVEEVGVVPVVAVSDFYRGRVVTAGCSTIFSEDSDVGFDIKSNKEFLQRCFAWLSFEEE